MGRRPEVGGPAPDFELANQFGESVTLSALRGQPVVVMFFPFAFSGICTGELGELRDNQAIFEAADARLLAVSVDHKYTLRAYAQEQSLAFDLLADFWPHGGVAQSYGAFDSDKGFAERATYFIDTGGTVTGCIRAPLGKPRDLEEYRSALGAAGERPR